MSTMTESHQLHTDQRSREASGARPYGRYLEDFEVGDVYEHWPAKTITEADDHLFCLITMNHHPLHINDVYAAESQQGRNVVVGPLVYSIMLGMSVADVSGPVVAIAFILAAVFIPVAFLGGISGRIYRQFALTIAVSVLLSAFSALSLSPALSAMTPRTRRFSATRSGVPPELEISSTASCTSVGTVWLLSWM